MLRLVTHFVDCGLCVVSCSNVTVTGCEDGAPATLLLVMLTTA